MTHTNTTHETPRSCTPVETATTRRMEVLASPDTDVSALAHAPQIARNGAGQLLVHLVGPTLPPDEDGDNFNDHTYPVREVAHLHHHRLVLLATADQSILMSAAEYEATVPHLPRAELDRQAAIDDAQDLADGLTDYIDRARLPPAALLLWDAGGTIRDDQGRYTSEEGLGHLLMLDALIAAPEVVQHALRRLRDVVAKSDPALALVGTPPTGVTSPAPQGVAHEIDEMGCELEPDGALTLVRYSAGPMVKLAPREVYALFTFLGLSSVRAKLEACEVARQTQNQQDFEAACALEEVQIAAREAGSDNHQ